MAPVPAEDRERERPRFELEDETEGTAHVPPPSPRPPAASAPRTPSAAHRGHEPGPRGAPPSAEAAEDSQENLLDARRRRRLLVYVPATTAVFLLVGWLFLGIGLPWFVLAGAGVGAFAAWRQRGEILLGSVAAAAGLGVCLVVVHVPLFFVIVLTGGFGFLIGIDDRLRN